MLGFPPYKYPSLHSLSALKKNSVEDFLILGLKESNASAINQLYKMYAPALLGIIKRIVKFDEVAEDVLQDTFVKIWKSIQLYDQSKGRLFTWMASLAKNLAIDQVRSKSAINTLKTDNILTIPVELIEHKSYFHLNIDAIGVKNLLNLLKSEENRILDMIYFQGYTHIQASEMLNIPLGTIKTKLRLSILALRKHFREIKIPA